MDRFKPGDRVEVRHLDIGNWDFSAYIWYRGTFISAERMLLRIRLDGDRGAIVAYHPGRVRPLGVLDLIAEL